MRQREFRELFEALRARLGTDGRGGPSAGPGGAQRRGPAESGTRPSGARGGCGAPPPRRAKRGWTLREEELSALLKERYGAEEMRLSEAAKNAAAARLLAAVRARSLSADRREGTPDVSVNGRVTAWKRNAVRVYRVPQAVSPGAPRASVRHPSLAARAFAAGTLCAILLVLAAFLSLRHGGADSSGGIQPAPGEATPKVTLVRLPGEADVPEGWLDPTGVLHFVYGLDRNGYYLQTRDGGRSFTRPARLNRRPGTVTVGGERGPKLACGKSGSGSRRYGVIHVVWLGQGGELWYTRSSDGGRSFAPERNVLDTRTGCDSPTVAADREGNVWIFWLDGRLPPDPRSPLASPIFMTRSTDGGTHFSANQLVRHDHPGLACACCRLEARLGPDDALYLSFRSGYRNIRDAYLLKGHKSENRFRSVRVSRDDWLFAG